MALVVQARAVLAPLAVVLATVSCNKQDKVQHFGKVRLKFPSVCFFVSWYAKPETQRGSARSSASGIKIVLTHCVISSMHAHNETKHKKNNKKRLQKGKRARRAKAVHHIVHQNVGRAQ